MRIETNYHLNDNLEVNYINFSDNEGLLVECFLEPDGLYTYYSDDGGAEKCPHKMNLPTCILHAYEFLGVLLPGTVREDVLT